MAESSATVGILRVLLTGNSAELEAAYKRSSSATKQFITELKNVQRESQTAGQALTTALGKALADAEKGTKGFVTAAKQLSGIDIVGQANSYAKAVDAIGGATKLTEAEQRKVNAVLVEALEKYKALGREAPESLQKLAKETAGVAVPTKQVTGFLGDMNNQIKATALGFLSAQAVIGVVQTGLSALVGFITSSVAAYAEQEIAVKKMTAALQSQGRATPDVIAKYKEMASQFQDTTGNADELVNEMQALLIEVGGVMPGEMNKALQAATDLSAGLGIDLRAATMLVGKAFAGETGAFKRYGIVLDETKLKTEGVTHVLDAIQGKFGGQAAAQLDTYTGRLKDLKNRWGELQETVGEIIVSDPILVASLRMISDRLKEGSGAVIDHDHAWSDLLRRMNIFGTEAPNIVARAVRAMEDAAIAANKAAKAAEFTPEKIKPIPSHITADEAEAAAERARMAKAKQDAEDLAEAQKKAAAAAKSHAEAIKALRDQLSGRALQADVKNLAEALTAEEKAGLLSEKTLKHIAEEAATLRKEGAILTPALFKIALAFGTISDEAGEMKRGLDAADKSWEVTTDDMKETLEILARMIPAMQKFVDGWEAIAKAGVGATQKVSMEDLEKIFGFKKEIPFIEKYHKALTDVGDAFGALASVTHGKTQAILLDLQALIDAAQDLGEGIARIAEGDILGGVSKLIQGGVKIFKQFFGSAGRDAVKEFAASMGGFDALRAKLAPLGAEGEKLWKALTQGVGRNNPQEAQKAIDNINAALLRLDQTNAKFNTSLGGTLSQIQALGGRLPDALKGYLNQLREAGRLTQENIDLLDALGDGSVNWDAVEAAAGRYGISIDKLGQAFNEAKLHKTWQQMIDDLALFADAGVDVNGLLSDMADEISAAVQRSMKFGTEIPENMRPWIQALIDSGQLLDENGDKITDISKLKFGATLQTTLEKLNDTLELLLKNILGIGPAIDKQPKKVVVDVEYRERRVPAPPLPPEPPVPPEDPEDRGPRLAGGGRVLALALGGPVLPQYAQTGRTIAALPGPARGTDTVAAMLTPGERVLTMPQEDWLRGAMIQTAGALARASSATTLATAALAHGAGAGPGGPALAFDFTIQAWDRADLGRAVREDVVPIVVDAINGNDRGARTQLTRRSKPLGAF